jgi:ABC-2 type transport system permease protein
MVGLTAVFGDLQRLPGFTADEYISFLVPVTLLQAAAFTGAATGVNVARDIELGWFDRILVSRAPRPVILAGLLASAGLLHIGLLRDLRGAYDWALALVVGAVGFELNLTIALVLGLAAWWLPRGARALRERPAFGA